MDIDKSIGSAQSGYARVNDLNLYYEIYGPPMELNVPLLLIHGGLGTTGMFAPLLPALAQARTVIAVEMQAHGHTADISRPLSFEGMADDAAALIEYLGYEQADIAGYSLGGGMAVQTAIRHPDKVRKLVVISAPFKRSGWYPEVLAGMEALNFEAAKAMVESPMHEAYASAAPRPEDWPVLVEKTAELLRKDYDWSADAAHIQAPVLIVIGDADSVRTAHALEMFALLGGWQADGGWDGSGMSKSRLSILPGTTHFNILTNTHLLLPVLRSFLDAPLPQEKG